MGTHYYTDDGSVAAHTALKLLPLMDKGEQLRLAAAVLMVHCDQNGGRLEVEFNTDEHRYTLVMEKGEL